MQPPCGRRLKLSWSQWSAPFDCVGMHRPPLALIAQTGLVRIRSRAGLVAKMAVPFQRFPPLGGMVYNWAGIGGRVGVAPGLMNAGGGQPAQFRHPALDVAALRVELAALCHRVEHPEVRSRVGARTSNPLPVELVRRQVAIDEVLHEPPGAAAPVQVQVFDQEAGCDHPGPVVHPTLGQKLAHAGVHDRVAGLAPCPGSEPPVRVAPCIDPEPAPRRPVRLSSRVRPMEQDVGEELAPAKLGFESAVAPKPRVEPVEDLPWMKAAEFQVGGEPGRAWGAKAVPFMLITAGARPQERFEQPVGGRFARRR